MPASQLAAMNATRVAAVIIILLFTALGVQNVTDNQNTLKLKNIELKSKATELKSLELKYDSLQIELNKTDGANKERIQQLEQEKIKLEQEKSKLERDLAAKKASKLQNVATSIPGSGTAYAASGGSCASWIAAAGISDVASANWLIAKESGCNPNAVNRSSGACGVAQELPCGKSGCAMGDGACQVRWMNSYVLSRYKSWANAVAFHRSHNWY